MTPASTPSEPRSGSSAAQWCIVTLLVVIAAVLVIAVFQTGPQAQAQVAPGSAAPQQGTFAVAGQISPSSYGLYLVDPQYSTIMVYEYDAGHRRLGLRAARTFLYDRQLEAYQTEPLPSEVADLVRQARRISDTTTQPQ